MSQMNHRKRVASVSIGFFVLIGLLLSGCATTYQEEAFTGGYSDMKLNERQYRVAFHGNGFSSRDDAYLFFLTRAAEIAKAEGYEKFYVVTTTDETTQSQITTEGEATTTTTGSVEGTYYDYGDTGQLHGQVRTTSTTTYTPPQTYNVSKPGFSGRVLLVNKRIKDAPAPFDADTVLKQGRSRNEEVERKNTIWSVASWGGLGLVIIIAVAAG